ncbi:MAG: prepilin-type N-terminal cleavage/methylation domain-containing protein [Phycisphaerales bacterium]|nr:prepilin-type N-terminal cleavage/methylation domain-containing protein [Phycisphaerales bacterium]
MRRPGTATSPRQFAERTARRAGFTLVELLVAGGVIVALLAVLLPTIGAAMERARAFRCQTSLRSVAFDFAVFANEELHGDRGDDRLRYGRTRFSLETFVESQYGVDEFWAFGDTDTHERPDETGVDPMRCSEIAGPVTLRRDVPCREGAVGPTENLSFGFNMRLLRVEYLDPRGRPRSKEVQLTSSVLAQGRTPLLWDIDGRAAASKDAQGLFSAPALDSPGVYAGDQHWFPGLRHGGRLNVAFIDGSVSASSRPLDESGWAWGWQPEP